MAEGIEFMIHLGDCLVVLRDMPDNCVDSIVTDPPYGLKFMGKKWDYDVPGVDVWRECLRVLKPGGHLLAFGGTRTYHRLVVAIEDAGFEIRDQIQWIYGSGFPKSLDVSKAIDKAAGAEREVVQDPYVSRRNKSPRAMAPGEAPRQALASVTAPSTEAAKQWQGWGTALKPANEPICLARKPLEGTVAANVQKHGTGAINVDGCRIEGEPTHGSGANMANKIYGDYKDVQVGKPHVINTQGRWPANVILSHDPECIDGQCTLFCAVKLLDEQTGIRDGARDGTKTDGCKTSSQFNGGKLQEIIKYGDSGGASRFFLRVSYDKEDAANRFLYTAKASKSERNAGLASHDLIWENEAWEKPDLKSDLTAIAQLAKATSEDVLTDNSSWSTDLYGHSISEQYPMGMISTIETVLKLITELKTSNASQSSNTKESIQAAIKTVEASGLSLAESVAFTSQLDLSSTREETASLLGVVRAALPMLLRIRGYAKSGNFHSTVKPIKLMRYLCKLITPPGGLVLDPFMGSGSTGVAALKEGFQFIGIEMNSEYVEIAKRRLDAVEKQTEMPL